MTRYSRSTAWADGSNLPGGLRRITYLRPEASRGGGFDCPPLNCRTSRGPWKPFDMNPTDNAPERGKSNRCRILATGMGSGKLFGSAPSWARGAGNDRILRAGRA